LKKVALPLMQSAAPGIEAGTRLLQRQGTVQAGAAGSSLRALQLSIVDPNYFDVLRLPVAAGRIDANTLAQTDTLVLSRATAQRLFGRGDVVGELVELRVGPVAWTAQVKAVLADLPGYGYAAVPKQAVEVMEAALRKAHNSPEWKDFAKRNMYQDVFLGSAEFSKFLDAKMAEYKEFYDAIGLAGKKN
jgi:hypothetical protein